MAYLRRLHAIFQICIDRDVFHDVKSSEPSSLTLDIIIEKGGEKRHKGRRSPISEHASRCGTLPRFVGRHRARVKGEGEGLDVRLPLNYMHHKSLFYIFHVPR